MNHGDVDVGHIMSPCVATLLHELYHIQHTANNASSSEQSATQCKTRIVCARHVNNQTGQGTADHQRHPAEHAYDAECICQLFQADLLHEHDRYERCDGSWKYSSVSFELHLPAKNPNTFA
jgi:hypothetical protein